MKFVSSSGKYDHADIMLQVDVKTNKVTSVTKPYLEPKLLPEFLRKIAEFIEGGETEEKL